MTKFTFKIKSIPAVRHRRRNRRRRRRIAEFFQDHHPYALAGCRQQLQRTAWPRRLFLPKTISSSSADMLRSPGSCSAATSGNPPRRAWALRKTNDRDDWLCSTFVEGLTVGGCCWFRQHSGQDCRQKSRRPAPRWPLKSDDRNTNRNWHRAWSLLRVKWAPALPSAAREFVLTRGDGYTDINAAPETLEEFQSLSWRAGAG